MGIQLHKRLKILLIGESCTDEYVMGSVTRISPEAPVPILDKTHTILKDGMAINVKNNLEALGCEVTFVTNDKSSITKKRFVDDKSNQQLLRVDEEQILKPLTKEDIPVGLFDAVVISDYCKGLIPEEVAEYICLTYGNSVFVDTKKEDLSCFPSSVIKVNQYESKLNRNLPLSSTKVITMGAKGSVCDSIFYPSQDVKVHDVTGAGDVFLAALTYFTSLVGLYKGVEAATLLATKSVEHFGTYTLTLEDLKQIGYFDNET